MSEITKGERTKVRNCFEQKKANKNEQRQPKKKKRQKKVQSNYRRD